jgi:hypothetical protein
MGIVFPISVINQVDPSFDISKLKVGQDVTEVMKITKHDPESALDVESVETRPANDPFVAEKVVVKKLVVVALSITPFSV